MEMIIRKNKIAFGNMKSLLCLFSRFFLFQDKVVKFDIWVSKDRPVCKPLTNAS